MFGEAVENNFSKLAFLKEELVYLVAQHLAARMPKKTLHRGAHQDGPRIAGEQNQPIL